jgi:hypothetical protein
MKLKKKVQDGLAFDQHIGHLHHILRKYCFPQQIDLLKLTQTKLLARIHQNTRVQAELQGPNHPSQHANSSTNAHNAYDTLP